VKERKISQGEGPVSALRRCQSKSAASGLPAIHTVIATFVILTLGMIPTSKGQTLRLPDLGSQAAQTQPSSLSLLAAQGRQHPGYQVFAGHLALPSIAVVGETTLEVGGMTKFDVSRLDRLTLTQKETLAGQFEVTVGVVDKLLASFSNPASTDAAQLAGKLRLAVIDYRYLLERWTQYRPPAGEEKVKADALLALRAGDIDKAWGMFVDLPKPKPPVALQIVVQN